MSTSKTNDTTVFIHSVTAMERETYGRSSEIARKISKSIEDVVGRATEQLRKEDGLMRDGKPREPEAPKFFTGGVVGRNIALSQKAAAETEASMTITALRQLVWQKEAELEQLRSTIARLNKAEALRAAKAERKPDQAEKANVSIDGDPEWTQPRSFFPRGI